MAEKEKKAKEVATPNGFIYEIARVAARIVLWCTGGYRCTGDAIPKEGPVLVLASHGGMLDFLPVGLAVPGRRVRFVITERFMRGGLLSAFLRWMAVIPKMQFHADPRCMSQILRTLRAGGTVGIFPAGQTSLCGVPGEVSPVIAKLVKKSGANVVAVRLQGSFFAKARFIKGIHRCPIHADVKLLYTPEQLKNASEEEIYDAIYGGIYYDEFAWQQQNNIRVRSKNRADGYDRVLFACPNCASLYTIRSEGTTVGCTACGVEAQVGEDMHLHWADDMQLPENLRDWFFRQQWAAEEALAQPGYHLEAPVTVLDFPDGKEFPVGDGKLVLDRDELRYEGTYAGEKGYTYAWKREQLSGVVAKPGVFVELYHADLDRLLRFRMKNPGQAMHLKVLCEAKVDLLEV
jgi:1-acyl-sn-glycerol-3-phosphate acyltransferase